MKMKLLDRTLIGLLAGTASLAAAQPRDAEPLVTIAFPVVAASTVEWDGALPVGLEAWAGARVRPRVETKRRFDADRRASDQNEVGGGASDEQGALSVATAIVIGAKRGPRVPQPREIGTRARGVALI